MGRLRRPELPPGALADLVRELHALHGRAGRPSMRTLAKGQRFSYTAVHDLFTRTVAEPPRLPVLITVVEQLASMAPRMDVEETLDRFDALWRAADAEPFDEPFEEPVEEPVEESTTAATSPEEVSPGAEPATSVAAAEREPAEPGAGEQTVLEQTAPHRPSEHTRPEQEETPLEHDAAGRERTARLEPAPARTAASARIDDDGGGRAVVDPRADAPAVLVDDGTAVGAVPQRLPATSALAEVILDKPIWIRTADGNLYPAPCIPPTG
jgi:hypothetical protein